MNIIKLLPSICTRKLKISKKYSATVRDVFDDMLKSTSLASESRLQTLELLGCAAVKVECYVGK